MTPRGIYISDGSKKEADEFIQKLTERGTLTKLTAYKQNYLCCTDPRDTARVERKTFIVTHNKYNAVPHVRDGVEGMLGRWMSPEEAGTALNERFPNCMTGRMMYVIPFSMGPLKSPMSKIGIQVTDSSYVLLSMRIMTRVSPKVFEALHEGDFTRCIHSVGCPRPVQVRIKNHWPCNPEKILIVQFPEQRMIKSYGSGYGGNSLLGKKCLALRIAGAMGRDEGWMAEHMLIMSVTTPQKKEHFIAAAFPSACGKTNMAMLTPSLPGFKVQCIGDDIAWMRFDCYGILRAINPESGFFGVAPGTNMKTNPIAMRCFEENSIFTNVGYTSDGRYFWEGLEDEVPEDVTIKNWLGQPWTRDQSKRAAHPNSRFTAPVTQCPILHPKWDDPKGVPISAILFGGRRPKGVPLVIEAKSWAHGVMLGACLKSETTAAAEFKGTSIMHDPMAMRPFIGYNFGHYLQHWLDMEEPGRQVESELFFSYTRY
ncbi:phosphoenolpyruvate carboxykinase [GTP] [Elysia marginata]|uniref:phosphoenolpyruvate carboxykinase (GTP) n=1 Tax=Elysia marginata TaxID=1093978 RepID=A0AAV4JG68_9GAST|nr:phosphoenolpyruvate carboxykinase [GTP] [Elysia marginata]